MPLSWPAATGCNHAAMASAPVVPFRGLPGREAPFAHDAARAELEFERYSGGDVRAVVLHQNGRFRAPRLEP